MRRSSLRSVDSGSSRSGLFSTTRAITSARLAILRSAANVPYKVRPVASVLQICLKKMSPASPTRSWPVSLSRLTSRSAAAIAASRSANGSLAKLPLRPAAIAYQSSASVRYLAKSADSGFAAVRNCNSAAASLKKSAASAGFESTLRIFRPTVHHRQVSGANSLIIRSRPTPLAMNPSTLCWDSWKAATRSGEILCSSVASSPLRRTT